MTVQDMWIGFGLGLTLIVMYILFVFRLPKFLFNDDYNKKGGRNTR